MDLLDGCRAGGRQVVDAAVGLRAAIVLDGEVLVLDAGAHGPVENQDFFLERIEVAAVGVFALCHRNS